jgi:ABC-type antimicrobial peptide transport system permease subunit
MALLGGLLGCGAAYVTFKLFVVGTGGIGPLSSIRVSPQIVGETMVLAALLGIVSAFVPGYAAVRRNIVDVLRLVA